MLWFKSASRKDAPQKQQETVPVAEFQAVQKQLANAEHSKAAADALHQHIAELSVNPRSAIYLRTNKWTTIYTLCIKMLSQR